MFYKLALYFKADPFKMSKMRKIEGVSIFITYFYNVELKKQNEKIKTKALK